MSYVMAVIYGMCGEELRGLLYVFFFAKLMASRENG